MSYSAVVTVPAGKVAATLTDFVTRVDLAHMPTAWWAAAASDGSNVRVRAAGSDVPVDLVWIDKTRRKGELFFKSTLGTAANVFTVDVVEGATAPAATDPIGRNAVWSDYDAVFTFPDLANRAGASASDAALVGTTFTDSPGMMLTAKAEAGAPTANLHEGIARDADGNFYSIDVDELVKFSPTWVELARNSTPLASTGVAGVNHMSDGTVYNGELYVPFQAYPSTTPMIEYVGVWRLSDLAFVRSYDLSALGIQFSGICYCADDGHFYGVGYDAPGSDTAIYRLDASLNHVGTITTPAIQFKQAIEWLDGAFYVTVSLGGTSSTSTSALHRITADGATATLLWSRSGGGYIEGLTTDGSGGLFVTNFSPDKVLRFKPYRGLGLLGSGHAKSLNLPVRTTWTVGATSVQAISDNLNRALFSYGANSGSDTARSTFAARAVQNAPNFGTWNSTNGWLNDPGTSPSTELDAIHRFHNTQNGTTDRKIWRDGVVKATGAASQRPVASAGAAALFFGVSDTDATEPWAGWITRAYLRNGVLSADWLAAEYASWETPETFYAVSAAPDTSATGTISATLPALSANLSGGVEFSGTIAATLPALAANLAGETFPPGIAGDLTATLPQLGASLAGAYSDTATLAAILPPLSAELAGTSALPPAAGSLAAVLPSLRSNLAGQSFKPGTEGYVEAFLPALTASLSGDVLGRAGLGLALDSSAVLTVEAALEPEPSVPPGAPSTALHIIAPTVPVPTLVAGRPQ